MMTVNERQPGLVVLVGLPGAGKTTLANWLAEHHGFVVSSRDTIRAAMFPDCRYTLEEKAAAYSGMKQSIAIMLRQGVQVVTDGICFSSQRERDEVIALGAAAGVRVVILACECPVAVAQQRVEHDRAVDSNALKDRDAALVVEVSNRFDPIPPSAVLIDTSAPVAAIRDEVARHLGLT